MRTWGAGANKGTTLALYPTNPLHRVENRPVTDSSPAADPKPKIDTSAPHSARVWNYWLGGKDHYPVDRTVGDQVMAMFPDITRLARADRAFLGRPVRYLAGDAGTRQFLDIGTGLPAATDT